VQQTSAGNAHAPAAITLPSQPQQEQQLQDPHQQQQLHLQSRSYVPFSELVFHQVVGRGSFKCVYRGSWHNTNVAIVRMHRGGLVTEARLMQQLSTHPNLVQFYR
jgi:hypothetical protein